MEEREPLRVARDWQVSPKRLDGWEPTWVTDYEYDEAGRLVRSVTRMLEPEWDDTTRSGVEALALMERDSCPGCGLHSSILDHPDQHRYTFEEHLCEVCKGKAIYGRLLAARDAAMNKSLEGAPPNVPRPTDGRHVYMRPMTDAERAKEDTHGRPPGKRPR